MFCSETHFAALVVHTYWTNNVIAWVTIVAEAEGVSFPPKYGALLYTGIQVSPVIL